MGNQQENLLNGYVPVIGYDKYFINGQGEIISFMRDTPKKLSTNRPPDTSTYIRLSLGEKPNQKKHLLHRLVYYSFNPQDDQSLEVNHIDGDKLNNKLENLEAVTRSENLKHAFSIGLKTTSGENNSRALLTEQDVLIIYHRLLDGESRTVLAKEYGVTVGVIGKIKTKANWNYLLKDMPDIEMQYKSAKLTQDVVINVCELLLTGRTPTEIIKEVVGVTIDQVSDIKRGRCHRSVTNEILNFK